MIIPGKERRQTRAQALLFAGKALVLQGIRGISNRLYQPRRFAKSQAHPGWDVAARSVSPLYTSENPAELRLQAGKVENLRVAARYLNGLRIPANEVFSFWAHLPRPTRALGFVEGRELREGCIIPNVGGGLCQLSNALYDCALKAGLEIVERHAHTRVIPGSLAEQGRDATVFWNYVDLRFRAEQPFRIGVGLSDSELIVEFRVERPLDVEYAASGSAKSRTSDVESCETCGMRSCFRHIGGPGAREITAWLVDAWWPEFDEYLRENRRAEDCLMLPLDGTRYRLRSYRWSTAGFGKIHQAPVEVLFRSFVSRRLAAQGAERQRALLKFDARLARSYATRIPPLARHLVVSQNLLPFLWRDGLLGGRTFDVLMTRLPIRDLQANLDRASRLYSGSRTIADFRVRNSRLVEDEVAALAAARSWITPHSEIAALNPERVIKLAWNSPAQAASCSGDSHTIYFPASTLARKGAYEVRETARRLGLRVILGGACIEDARFWDGVEVATQGDASVVVLPAWVEHQPRRLLAAAAAGKSVVASDACGLKDVPNVISVPAGEVDVLIEAIRGALDRKSAPLSLV